MRTSRPGALRLAAAGASLAFLLLACSLFAQTPAALPSATPPPPTPTDLPPPTESPGQPTHTAGPTARPAPSIPNPEAYTWVEVAEGFRQPLLVTHAGDGANRLFVLEQRGVIWVIENGQVLATPFLDIASQVGSQASEQGLLGMAFHPNYEENGYFYLDYTRANGDTVVSRWRVSDDPNVADAASEESLLQVGQPFANHNGGHLAFGPDGYLYISLGDGGSGGDPGGNGQNPNTLLGSILRLDVDSASPYAIPPDNPFANGGGQPHVWVYGLRNPWRFSFDALTGDIFIADVGQNEWEEVNFLPGGIVGGANFGWNYLEGTHVYAGAPPENLDHLPPVAEYSHASGGCSVTGGHVYRGAAMPEWQGVYLYGDYCSGVVYGLVQGEDGQWQDQVIYSLPYNISSFGLDEQGELYLVDHGGGIYRLQPQ